MAVPRIAIIDYRIMHTLQKCWVVDVGKEGLERGLQRVANLTYKSIVYTIFKNRRLRVESKYIIELSCRAVSAMHNCYSVRRRY
ncbi:MAG: hypothetical protein H6Q41_4085 [Deltaproteobacteria bacterium]|nr:hypothetical protein [Deltaproteobacteria bacterium]